MFDYPIDKSFIDFAIERGVISFLVRGNIECDIPFDFINSGIRVSPPTVNLKVFAEDEKGEPIGLFHINELHEEAVFPGEIELSEKTERGVFKALGAIEFWADFICFTQGNPRLIIELQHPIEVIISVSRVKLEPDSIDRDERFLESYLNLSKEDKSIVARALWWYRKGCNTFPRSVFDGYTAYWNCLEILCDVGTGKINEGANIEQNIHDYLKDKVSVGKDGQVIFKIKPGHVLHCYNQFVGASIPRQMKSALKKLMDEQQAAPYIYQCFDIKPAEEQLYKIRNDINHGNVQENSSTDLNRAYRRGMLLWHMVFKLLNQKLGRRISLGGDDDLNILTQKINSPFLRDME